MSATLSTSRAAGRLSSALRTGGIMLVLSMTSPAGSAETKTVNTIMLKDRGEIVDAAVVYEALQALVNDAQTCSSPRTEACICSFTTSVNGLDNAYRSAVDKHPVWGLPNTGVEYENPKGGGTDGIVMSNVKRQLAMCGRSH
jgi:hypothetical protein